MITELTKTEGVMQKVLGKYHSGYFTFRVTESLGSVCNAPIDKSGVYLVWDMTTNNKELIYIGSSGHINNDGKMHVRKSGLGGIRDRIVNGHQFNKEKRYVCWPKQMSLCDMSTIEVCWYITHSDAFIHSPCYVEHCLLHEYYSATGRLPKWNMKF